MLENKLSDVFPHNGPDNRRPDPLHPDHKFRRFSDLPLPDGQRFVPRFQQGEHGPLFERALADLFLNVEENVELNVILSSINKRGAKQGSQRLHDKLELNFRNSLHKNLAQRSSIKKFMGLLFNDALGILTRKEVCSPGRCSHSSGGTGRRVARIKGPSGETH
jgi:hypothetical protein